MAATLVIALSWLMTFLLVGNPVAALAIIVLVSGAILGLGSRLSHGAAVLALAAILVGGLMRAVGLAPILIPALAAGLGVGLLWKLTHARAPLAG